MLAQASNEAIDKKLTDCEAALVAEYLVDLNATQAATRAVHGVHSAWQMAPRPCQNRTLPPPWQGAQIAQRSRRTASSASSRASRSRTSPTSSTSRTPRRSCAQPTASPNPRSSIASVKVKRFPERVGVDDE